MSVDDMNYWNDRRTRAAHGKWYTSLDERTMHATVALCDDHGHEYEARLPVRWEVCSLCDGNGSHVNPSIDCGGIMADEFADDPGFADAYFGGAYDQPCNTCNGRRVEPVIDRTCCDPEVLRRVDEQRQDMADMYAEMAAERARGA